MLRESARESSRRITMMAPDVEPDVRVSSGISDWKALHLNFRAAPGWRGRIERPDSLESRVILEPTTA
jgi:hypothetical protein